MPPPGLRRNKIEKASVIAKYPIYCQLHKPTIILHRDLNVLFHNPTHEGRKNIVEPLKI